jgi:hypothetical protein
VHLATFEFSPQNNPPSPPAQHPHKNQPLNCAKTAPKSALIHLLKKNPNTFQFICKIYPIYALKPPTPKPQKIDLILALNTLKFCPNFAKLKGTSKLKCKVA